MGKPLLRREVDNPVLDLPLVKGEDASDLRGDDDDDESHSKSATCVNNDKRLQARVVDLTFRERLKHTLALWPFMVPLFIVYFSEYAMQSGCWAAIGFPVEDKDSRAMFYEFANWTYQVGVLISRSSGTFITWIDLRELWIMPILQFFILLFFIFDAMYKFWYDWFLLVLCLIVGLFGGACYVHGFSRLSESVDPSLREFSLSAASVGDTFGVILGDIAGIFIQKAIYQQHDLSDDN